MANTDSNIELTAQGLLKLQDVMRRHQHEVELMFGVSYLEMSLIQFVLQNGNQKMKEVADNFFIKLSTLTTIIDKAETRKLLKRTPSKEDRRVVFLEVTRKGEEIYNRYVEQTRDLVRRMCEIIGLDAVQMKELIENINKMPLI